MASPSPNNGRLVLLLIAGIPVIIVLAATWLWFFVARGEIDIVGALGTANRGTLLQPPRQLAEAELLGADGQALEFAALSPQWTFVVPNAGEDCAASCEHLLYLTRQIHLALGKEYNRVRRFYVGEYPPQDTTLAVEQLSDGHALPADFATYLSQEHGDLRSLRVSARDFGALFREVPAAPDTWYLVDPAGWVMMSYDDSVSYKDVIADLKFLLKNASN